MDFYSFVNGPLIWVAFLVFTVGLLTRLAFFFSAVVRDNGGKDQGWGYYLITFGRSLLPFHRAAPKKPVYAGLRYVFHICLFAVPIWLSGHIVLWSESRLEWDWAHMGRWDDDPCGGPCALFFDEARHRPERSPRLNRVRFFIDRHHCLPFCERLFPDPRHPGFRGVF